MEYFLLFFDILVGFFNDDLYGFHDLIEDCEQSGIHVILITAFGNINDSTMRRYCAQRTFRLDCIEAACGVDGTKWMG